MKKTTSTYELLKKYDRPGPRYTSYPTAPEFRHDFTRADYIAALARAGQDVSLPLSLYVHIPFCERRCHFCGCTTVITNSRESVSRYLTTLDTELASISKHLGSRRSLMQLHWGGGTPTHLTIEEIERLFHQITDRFTILPDAEVAIEVDPRVTTAEHIEKLREIGFNRLSMGIQDFTPVVQAAIGRWQTLQQSEALYHTSRAYGFRCINMDLIYGLPKQTVADFAHTIDEVARMRPDRVALYSYAYLPAQRSNQRLINATWLPSLEDKFRLFATAVDKFVAAGYIQIGMDHFALPDDELAISLSQQRLHRNFMGYTTKPAADMIGIGMSAIGDLAACYAQNISKIGSYHTAIATDGLATYRGYRLSHDDLIRRRLITFFMCNFVMPFDLLKREFVIDYHQYFAREDSQLDQFVADGLLERRPEALAITPVGRIFIRNVAMVFDAYLNRADRPQQQTFSRTI
ncbi:MAG: oxygen-independent coproporphyrinogen III oxidase [candidate division Zixibacteria bacterium]|nr:oxygen-independent coproporphyrinogen III oxidase [candidate division Zixibacteria bacterium]